MEATYDPIVSSDGLPRFRLSQNRPAASPGRALVLFREGEPLITIWPEKRLTAGEARWGRFKAVHLVDVTDHRLAFECELPSAGDAFHFHADVTVDCTVVDPATVVERNVRNVGEVVGSFVRQTMRNVTRQYDVKDVAAAEVAVCSAVAGLTSPHPAGIAIKSVYVQLTLDEEAAHWKKELERIEREKELELERAQANAHVKQHEETEDLASKMRNVDFFKTVMSDPVGLLALHAAQSPEDLPGIIQMLRKNDLDKLDHYYNVFKLLMENGALEGYQVEEYAMTALKLTLDGARKSIAASFPSAVLTDADAGESADPDGAPGAEDEGTDPEAGEK